MLKTNAYTSRLWVSNSQIYIIISREIKKTLNHDAERKKRIIKIFLGKKQWPIWLAALRAMKAITFNYLCHMAQIHTQSRVAEGEGWVLSSDLVCSCTLVPSRCLLGNMGLAAVSRMETSSSKGPPDHHLHGLA